MTIKERLEIEAKTYSFGDQNEKRTFLAGADFAIKAVIEMLEERKENNYKNCYEDEYMECQAIINLLKSEA